jgi:hypothetical protein
VIIILAMCAHSLSDGSLEAKLGAFSIPSNQIKSMDETIEEILLVLIAELRQ